MFIDDSIKDAYKVTIAGPKVYIGDFAEADILIRRLECKFERICIEFGNEPLKSYFIHNWPYPVINCNASLSRFSEDINTIYNEKTIFNNLNFCNELDIFNIVYNLNNPTIL